MLMPYQPSIRKQIFESVESAMIEAITPQVWAISVIIEPVKSIVISMFVHGSLPEEERSYLNMVSKELLCDLPHVTNVKIIVIDDAIQPLKPIGTWLFIRKGVQADRGMPPQMFP